MSQGNIYQIHLQQKFLSNSEANEIDNLIGVIPSIKDKCYAQESDFDKFGRELVSQLYALGDQCTISSKQYNFWNFHYSSTKGLYCSERNPIWT